MTDKFPDSFIVQQLIEFLDYIDESSKVSLETINKYTALDDNGVGYAKASGHAKALLEYYTLKTNTLRSILNA